MPDNFPEEINLNKGDSTTIKLKGLATAGYEWAYSIDDEKDCIKISKEFEPYDGKDKTKGSNADEVFTITAQKQGSATIHFMQQRNWEKNANPVSEKIVKITVGD